VVASSTGSYKYGTPSTRDAGVQRKRWEQVRGATRRDENGNLKFVGAEYRKWSSQWNQGFFRVHSS